MSKASGTEVIWRRTIDSDGDRRRRARFVKWYCIPAAMLMVVVAIATGPGGALGILILFGGVGLLLWTWIFLTGRNLRANPTLLVADGALRVGKTDVPLASVQRWTTYPRRISAATGDTGSNSTTVHVAGFALRSAGPDGSMHEAEREFVWPLLSEDDQKTLGSALESVLPGKRVPLESLRSVRS